MNRPLPKLSSNIFMCDDFPIRSIKLSIKMAKSKHLSRKFKKSGVYCRTCENMAISWFIDRLYEKIQEAGGR